MNKEINKKIEELKQLFSDYTTSVNITITGHDTVIRISERTPKQLKDSYISMKNIKGEFIK